MKRKVTVFIPNESAPLPKAGEIWLNVETGFLYEMREYEGAYRTAHRVGASETCYGCDPRVFLAVWDSAVRDGQWIKVENCPKIESIR